MLRIVTALSVGSIFSSALLLFLVQPMIAKLGLPLFGGSPAVWNTCLLFFQGLLLCGYAYSHFGARLLGHRGQLVVHALLVLAPLWFLPPGFSPSFQPVPGAWPVPSLLGQLTLSVGLPFFVLSTNSSLVQHWFQLRSGAEPYFLYAASNAGSLLALVAYPFLIEPSSDLHGQLRAWSIGYLCFAALTGVVMVRAFSDQPARTATRAPSAPPVTSGQRLRWVFLSAVASSLLLAVSLRITTDVAAMPLLWVVPLALYLVSFILAFLPSVPFPRRLLSTLTTISILLGLGIPVLSLGSALWLQMTVPLATLFLGCWLCHAELAADRPAPEQVTAFYLWIAVGGFAGGLFGNIVAPMCFNSVAEYPITLALLALVLALGEDRGARLRLALGKRATWLRLLSTAALFLAWTLVTHYGRRAPFPYWHRVPLGLLAASLLAWRLPWQFPVASALTAALLVAGLNNAGTLLEAHRSFYGTLRVTQVGARRELIHGTTIHGMQLTDPVDRMPTMYYYPAGPLGEVVLRQPADARIGVVGLGTGSLAELVGQGQRLTYYELDPTVEPLARRWFTFLADARGAVDVRLGDARLTLAHAPDGGYQLLIIDAFSSDAIPVHLLTLEAIRLYLDKLAPGGLVVFHITNRYLDLARVLRGVRYRLGVSAAIRRFEPTAEQKDEEASTTHAIALSRSPAAISALVAEARWQLLPDGPTVVWTDDRSSLLRVLSPRE